MRNWIALLVLAVSTTVAWNASAETFLYPFKPVVDPYSHYPKEVREELAKAEKSVGQEADEVDAHKVAYAYAYSPSEKGGLDLSQAAARTFAESFSKLADTSRARYLVTHQRAFRYAYAEGRNGGMDMSLNNARAFAEKMVKQKDGLQEVLVHQEAFKHAYSTSPDGGLDLSSTQARAFADKLATMDDAFKILERHRKAFKYAYSRASQGGLDLSLNAARAFADEKSGFTKK